VRGLRTQIEVRGHCNPRPVDGTKFADHFDLSYQRARAIADGLIAHGVDADRILIVAASTHQPVTRRNYTATERQANDIVEVVQLPQRVEQFDPEPHEEGIAGLTD
jgi:flagellar motor protein MotB